MSLDPGREKGKSWRARLDSDCEHIVRSVQLKTRNPMERANKVRLLPASGHTAPTLGIESRLCIP